MTTFAKLKREASKYGATVVKEREGDVMVLRCEAPAGYIWNEGSVHEFVDETYTGPNDYADVISRMGYGIMECPFEDCDWCNS